MKISNLFKFNLFWLLGTVAWGMDSDLPSKLKKTIDKEVVANLEFKNDHFLTRSFLANPPCPDKKGKGILALHEILKKNKGKSDDIFQ